MAKKLLAALSMAVAVTMIVILIVDNYNPMMGFLVGNPAEIYLLALCLLCGAEAVVIYFGGQRPSAPGRHGGRHSRPSAHSRSGEDRP